MDVRHARLAKIGVSLLIAFGLASAQAQERAGRVQGDTAAVFGADVSVWATTDADGAVAEVGATLPLAAVEDAEGREPEGEGPPLPHSVAVLALPEVARDATVFDHLEIHFEEQGHPPDTYRIPHFDFHFNAISQEDVAAIDCSDQTPPADALVPSGYVVPPDECVPGMGHHGIPAEAVEAAESFSSALVLGYYAGDFIFIEPMVAQEALLNRETHRLDVPAIEGTDDARLPSEFTARYDAEQQAYELVFSGFGSDE